VGTIIGSGASILGTRMYTIVFCFGGGGGNTKSGFGAFTGLYTTLYSISWSGPAPVTTGGGPYEEPGGSWGGAP